MSSPASACPRTTKPNWNCVAMIWTFRCGQVRPGIGSEGRGERRGRQHGGRGVARSPPLVPAAGGGYGPAVRSKETSGMTLRIGVDIGGTFTDLVAIAADGRVTTRKVASTPSDYGDGIIAGLTALLAAQPGPVADVLHATTVGSNTVLEGKGARTALITTQGFRDILEIRDLRMPVLYDLRWTKPRAFVERRLRLEVIEKLRPDGTVSTPLDRASVDAAIAMLRAEKVESVAICLLHSYANPAHERAVAD